MTELLIRILSSPYFFVERFGRRKLLMSSAAACSICMLIISFMLYVNTRFVSKLFVPNDNKLLAKTDRCTAPP